MNKIIEINNITKDYGNHKGVFNVSFNVYAGEVLGFLGPNGAGKTTTIRQIMGFIKSDQGSVTVKGLDCFNDSDIIQKNLGYLPGEIAFMDDMTGMEFIHFIGKLKGMKSFKRAEELMKYFELDPRGRIRKMSKGMKQKIAIVCAFMQEPEILILDEPTSGLDPLMQSKFVDLIVEEKKKGTTILMSSHIFEEVERTCDRAAIIKNGNIVAVEEIEKLKENKIKIVDVYFPDKNELDEYAKNVKYTKIDKNKITLEVDNMNEFIKGISKYNIKDLDIRNQALEDLFMHFYGEDKS